MVSELFLRLHLIEFLDAKLSFLSPLDHVNTEWILEGDGEGFDLSWEVYINLWWLLLGKLEDRVFKVGTIQIFFALRDSTKCHLEWNLVDKDLFENNFVHLKPVQTWEVRHRSFDSLQKCWAETRLSTVTIFSRDLSDSLILIFLLKILPNWFQDCGIFVPSVINEEGIVKWCKISFLFSLGKY